MSTNAQQIIVPPTTEEGNEGLRNYRGIWHVTFEVDGKTRSRSTRTRDVRKARVLRDRLYGKLKRDGAIEVKGKGQRAVLRVRANPEDDTTYIHKRPPFTVTIGGRFVGEFETREEARVARNGELGINVA